MLTIISTVNFNIVQSVSHLFDNKSYIFLSLLVVGQISVEELVEGVPVSEVLVSEVVATGTSKRCNLERNYVNLGGKWIVFNRSRRIFTSHTLTWL